MTQDLILQFIRKVADKKNDGAELLQEAVELLADKRNTPDGSGLRETLLKEAYDNHENNLKDDGWTLDTWEDMYKIIKEFETDGLCCDMAWYRGAIWAIEKLCKLGEFYRIHTQADYVDDDERENWDD